MDNNFFDKYKNKTEGLVDDVSADKTQKHQPLAKPSQDNVQNTAQSTGKASNDLLAQMASNAKNNLPLDASKSEKVQGEAKSSQVQAPVYTANVEQPSKPVQETQAQQFVQQVQQNVPDLPSVQNVQQVQTPPSAPLSNITRPGEYEPSGQDALLSKMAKNSTASANKMRFNAPQGENTAQNEGGTDVLANTNGFVVPKNIEPSVSYEEKRKIPWGYIIVGIIAIIAIIVFAVLLTRGTALPAMQGWKFSDAQLWASENNVLIRQEEQFSDEVADGVIISQSPAEGEAVSGGDFLNLVVSAGPDLDILVPVPDIMNMTKAEIEAWAEENKMTTVRIITEDSLTIPAGNVIEFTVNDATVLDTEIKRDTPLYVVISNGKGEASAVELPNFLTMSVDEAEKFGTDNNIIVQINEEFSDTIAQGQIISQNIKAEETIHQGDTVILIVSKGKEIRVPNFANLTKTEAEFEASKLGITISTDEKYMLGVDEDKLISQSIAAGTLYESGDYVELVYSLGETYVIQSMVGSNEVAIRDWYTPLQEKGINFTLNTTYTESDKAKGTILSQDKIDVTIKINETINFVVSSGPAIYAPDLVADASASYPNIVTREAALAACTALGIVPIIHEGYSSGREPGEVYQQSVAPGTKMQSGAVFEIWVQAGSPSVAVPDFVSAVNEAGLSTLANANYFVVKYTSVTNDGTKTEGEFISQSISAGTIMPYGTEITIERYGAVPVTPTP